MTVVRRLIRSHGRLMALLCLVAVVVRLLIPTGYMLAEQRGGVAVVICPQMVAAPMAAMDHGMKHGAAHDPAPKHGAADAPCPFAALSLPSLGAVDAVVLVVALAIVAVLALIARPRLPARASTRLRPPLRGPPLSV